MKRVVFDKFIKKLNCSFSQIEESVMSDSKDWSFDTFRGSICDMFVEFRTEIWENSQSIDGLQLQHSFFDAYYSGAIKHRIKEIIDEIHDFRKNQNYKRSNDPFEKEVQYNPASFNLYEEELILLHLIEDKLNYLTKEMQETLFSAVAHVKEMEYSILGLKHYFKIDEEYDYIKEILVRKRYVTEDMEWIDRSNGYKSVIADLVCTLLRKRYLTRSIKISDEDISKIIKNAFDEKVSTQTIGKYKNLDSNLFKDLKSSAFRKEPDKKGYLFNPINLSKDNRLMSYL